LCAETVQCTVLSPHHMLLLLDMPALLVGGHVVVLRVAALVAAGRHVAAATATSAATGSRPSGVARRAAFAVRGE
jgi:hypothetical protein